MSADRSSGPLRGAAPVLTALALPDGPGLERAAAALAGAEVLPISTCQRHELFVLGPDVAPPPPGATRLAEQADAAARLFLLAAGALSDVPGERFVAEQVRAALRAAQRGGMCGRRLGRLTRMALAAGDAARQRAERVAGIVELPDLVADLAAAQRPACGAATIALLGAGPLARSVRRSLARNQLAVACWATRRPSAHRGPRLSLEEATAALRECTLVISALAGGAGPRLPVPAGATTIDLGAAPRLERVDWTAASIAARARPRLAPQEEALRQAVHRLPAAAAQALAQVISPSVAAAAAAITRFRDQVIEAEAQRLGPLLARLAPEDAERVRRGLHHAATRCLHPLHEHVNQLGRQARPEEAGLLVDHLLGTRVGYGAPRPAAAPGATTPGASTEKEPERGSAPGA
jgi:glutamyl-tRNA reductase